MPDVVVHGKWSKFEERGEWRQFEIDVPGKQYPVRASTSKPEIIEAAMALRDQDATFTINEKESSRINERSGKPYIDRYLNSVQAGHVGEQSTPVAATGASLSTSKGDLGPEAVARIEEQQRRSFMSYSWGHAIELDGSGTYTGDDHDLMFARVQALQRKIYADITGSWGAERDPSYFPTALREQWEPQHAGSDVGRPEVSEHDDNIPF